MLLKLKQINVLKDVQYIESEFSQNFAQFRLKELIPQYLNRCKTEGRNKTMKAFRAWVKQQILSENQPKN
jgi:hypothetical protein